jgi:ribosomal protein L11 methyltransferase
MWRLALRADASVADVYAQALEPLAASVSIYEAASGSNAAAQPQPEEWATDVLMSGTCVVEALYDVPPATEDLTDALVEAASGLGASLPPISWDRVEDVDWVGHSQAMNPAIRAGRVLVRPSYVEHAPPAPIVLHLDAGRAFGSGSHATTFGCLMALQGLGFRPRHIADIGTGSGVLALAAARLFPDSTIIASEIDARALEVAAYNFDRNGARIQGVVANGWRHRALRSGPRFDLILENLLYRPLLRLSVESVRRLAPGGRLVAAGLLDGQDRPLLQRYRALGLVLEARTRERDWPCLVLRKPAGQVPCPGIRTF